MKFFEDVRIGEQAQLGAHTFEADDIKAFATAYDPQLFHVDEEAAARSHFGKLVASGWHTAAICMRRIVDHKAALAEDMKARHADIADLGPSPGFKDMRWLKPVYAGDTITFRSRVIEKVDLKSRPNWGIVSSRHEGVNEAGDIVFSFIGYVFVERRAA